MIVQGRRWSFRIGISPAVWAAQRAEAKFVGKCHRRPTHLATLEPQKSHPFSQGYGPQSGTGAAVAISGQNRGYLGSKTDVCKAKT